MQAVMSMDTLINGVHFPLNTSAADIAYKSLAVNLSDLAAMAATPAWFMLSLSLPDNNESWLHEFSSSLKEVAETFQLELIGGDTCRGP
jgi:thiamine-monophosphate kinase